VYAFWAKMLLFVYQLKQPMYTMYKYCLLTYFRKTKTKYLKISSLNTCKDIMYIEV